MQYINCEECAAEILAKVQQIPEKKKLIILTAGDNQASKSYVKGKLKDCALCGIPYEHIIMPEESDENDLGMEIIRKNLEEDVGGIIVQLPLPNGWNENFLVSRVWPQKDVDGFVYGSAFLPCTPEGIIYLLKKELGDLTGKNALVIGRGKLVGKPIAKMLLKEDCTVTIAHSKTLNLDELLAKNDIIVTAAGRAGLVDLKKCNAEVVIDASINRNERGKLCGDCFNFDPDIKKNMKVTSVPGGVGLMTRAMLMKHMGDASCM